MRGGRAGGRWWLTAVLLALAGWSGGGAGAQELADYDYENLSFRGISIEGGYLIPDLVEPTFSVGARVDLGFLGPGLRIVPFVSYWSSELEEDEVADLEGQVRRLIVEQGGGPVSVDLGKVEWSDFVVGVDGHFVWNVPLQFVTYLGIGGAAHILNGSGEVVDGTFVEDLLDSVRAGVNAHLGVERPVSRGFRVYSNARFEVLEDLQYFEIRLGGQFTFGGGAEDAP